MNRIFKLMLLPLLFSCYQVNGGLEDNVNNFVKENSEILGLVGICSTAYAAGCISASAYIKFKNWRNTNLLDDLSREPYVDRYDRANHLKLMSDILKDLNFDINEFNTNRSYRDATCKRFMTNLVKKASENQIKSNFSYYLKKHWFLFASPPEHLRPGGDIKSFVNKLKKELSIEIKLIEDVIRSKTTKKLARLNKAYYRTYDDISSLLQLNGLSSNNQNNRIYATSHILRCVYDVVMDIFNPLNNNMLDPIDVRLVE